MGNDIPAVSILMAAYNAGNFVTVAVESLLKQTYADYELVIVDDASSDHTASILAEFATRDKRIRVLRNGENRGLVYSLNRGLAHCRAPLVARADADDIFHPERLARQVAFLDSHPEIGVLGSAVEFIDENGAPVLRPLHGFPTSPDEVRLSSMFGCCLWHTTVMFRKNLVEAAGGYSPSFHGGPEDFDLWARLLETTALANLPDTLAKQRLHGKSVTATWTIGNELFCAVAQRLMNRYLGRTAPPGEVKAVVSACSWQQEVPPDQMRSGVRLLRDLATRCSEREAPHVAEWFRAKYGASLVSYAGTIVYRQPGTAAYLLLMACFLSPRLVSSPELLKNFLRVAVPGPLRRKLKRAGIRRG